MAFLQEKAVSGRKTMQNPRVIELPERFDRAWIEQHRLDLLSPEAPLRLDFSRTRVLDSAGASLLHLLNREFKEARQSMTLVNLSDSLRSTLESWTANASDQAEPAPKSKSLPERVGDGAIAFGQEVMVALSVLVEMLYWGSLGAIKRRDFKKGSLGEQMYQLGFRALGIVSLLAFLIGVVLALQTAIQLRTYGAEVFLAPMVGIMMISELGPLMTAIILAGRTGSATTAEIATMGVQEEIDALRTMSLNPIQFIVAPKFWAITITMPALSTIAVGAGILGGYLVGVFYLDISSNLFWSELGKNIFLRDVRAGFIKSVVFSWLIVWIGAYYGFKVRGGAEEVGKETTASVVTAIFIIIIADAAFSFIL
jgi:phospholipid/cholesterol/gamma-HCH transport system permease protein